MNFQLRMTKYSKTKEVEIKNIILFTRRVELEIRNLLIGKKIITPEKSYFTLE